MTDIILYEFEPTRSQKCRWALLEAGLDYQSAGNSIDIIHSDGLRKVHPLGKLPAAVIDGKPLFESSAIVTAIADLAPERNLIAKPGSWERNLHNQWTCFAASELETWAWSALLNSRDFLLPKEQHVPAIIGQLEALFKRSAAVLETALGDTGYMIENRFTVTDIIVGYAINMGRMVGFLGDGLPNLHAYLDRLYDREHCTFSRP